MDLKDLEIQFLKSVNSLRYTISCYDLTPEIELELMKITNDHSPFQISIEEGSRKDLAISFIKELDDLKDFLEKTFSVIPSTPNNADAIVMSTIFTNHLEKINKAKREEKEARYAEKIAKEKELKKVKEEEQKKLEIKLEEKIREKILEYKENELCPEDSLNKRTWVDGKWVE